MTDYDAQHRELTPERAARVRAKWRDAAASGEPVVFRTIMADRRYEQRPDTRATVTRVGRTKGTAVEEVRAGDRGRGREHTFDLATGYCDSKQGGSGHYGRVLTGDDVALLDRRADLVAQLRERHDVTRLPGRGLSVAGLADLLALLDRDVLDDVS